MAAEPASPPEGCNDFFELLGLPRRFEIDRAALEGAFYRLSRESHPDRFAAQGGEALKSAISKMSQLNEAFRTLGDPQSLREHYLKLEGFHTGTEGLPGCVTGVPTQGPAKPAVPAGQLPIELAEAWFELQDSLLEQPEGAKERVDEFERRLAAIRGDGDAALAGLEAEIDRRRGQAGGAAPRDLLERLSRELRGREYLASLARDLERIRKRAPWAR